MVLHSAQARPRDSLASGGFQLLHRGRAFSGPQRPRQSVNVLDGFQHDAVSWPKTGAYALQQNSNLATGTWTTSGYSITTANGTNSITITPPPGNLFFRLKQ